jgi:hypothetical protein
MLAKVIHRPLVMALVLHRTPAMAANHLERMSRPIRMLPKATAITLMAIQSKIMLMLPKVKAVRCDGGHHILGCNRIYDLL